MRSDRLNSGEISRTNGELVGEVVTAARAHLAAAAAWAAANPDEAAVLAGPVVLAVLINRRGRLTFAESIALSQLGYWCGVLALDSYRRWKQRPAGPIPQLREVK